MKIPSVLLGLPHPCMNDLGAVTAKPSLQAPQASLRTDWILQAQREEAETAVSPLSICREDTEQPEEPLL